MFLDRYLVIDKNIIKEGHSYNFSIYAPTVCNKNVKLIKRKNASLTNEDIVFIDEETLLYVCKSEFSDYKKLIDELKNNKLNPYISPQNFINEQSKKFYQDAEKVLSSIFRNPESPRSYQKSKKLISNLADSITYEEFTVKSLISSVEHEYKTHTHSLNVAIYAMGVGTSLKMDQESILELGESAILHDIGKSKISDEILNREEDLTASEFSKFMTYPLLGYSIGVKVGIKSKKILQGIKYHSENLDGTGFPEGLFGNSIPLYARIISVCDKFDTLTSKRGTKEALTTYEAIKVMKTTMKNHIDMGILNAMIMMFR